MAIIIDMRHIFSLPALPCSPYEPETQALAAVR